MHASKYGLCSDCKLDINDNYCLRCGRHKVGIGDYCDECAGHVLYFDEARSAVSYDGNAKDIVRRFKYGNARYLARFMARYMLDVMLVTDWSADCITFVPMHKARHKKRGYNQAELLARAVAEWVDIPCEPLLLKVKNTENQARLSRDARLENLKDAFAVDGNVPKHIILIDDVMTTGSTASECARMLKKAGASVVYLLTFASVPERAALTTAAVNIKDFRK